MHELDLSNIVLVIKTKVLFFSFIWLSFYLVLHKKKRRGFFFFLIKTCKIFSFYFWGLPYLLWMMDTVVFWLVTFPLGLHEAKLYMWPKWCIPIALGSQDFPVPNWKFQLERPFKLNFWKAGGTSPTPTSKSKVDLCISSSESCCNMLFISTSVLFVSHWNSHTHGPVQFHRHEQFLFVELFLQCLYEQKTE